MPKPGRPVLHTTYTCRKCHEVCPRESCPIPGTCQACYVPRKVPVDEQCCKECRQTKPIAEFVPTNNGFYLKSCKQCYAPIATKRVRKHKYGVDDSIVNELYETQGRRCAVPGCCAPLETIESAHVDHNHETGGVRGLLCHRCNVLEGHISSAGRGLIDALFEWSARLGTVYNARKRKLTDDERRYIAENPDNKSLKELAELFQYTASGIREARRMYLTRTS